MNPEAIEKGKYLTRYYYTAEAVAEMLKEFHRELPMLSDDEFPAYVAYLYDLENAPVDPHCW